MDSITNYFDESGLYYLGTNRDRNRKVGNPIKFQDVSIAYVGDKSVFGLTAPMEGHRYRFEIKQTLGELNYTTLLADYRKYHYIKPISLAFRAYHISRFGKDVDSPFTVPLYLGYETMIRGYTFKAFNKSLIADPISSITPEDLLGNKMFVSNFEVRFPFTGPEKIAAIKSGMLFTDLNLFFDSGIAWGKSAYYGVDRTLSKSKFITSTGVSLRINLFGQLILEPYYAIPLQLKGNANGNFGLLFAVGW
jgi:outer membrane protein assembly factor BamA